MTYRQIEAVLTGAGVPDAATDAALLVCRFAGIPAYALPYRRDEDFDSERLAAAVKRRAAREPLQYILGSWEFCGHTFRLNPDCLCPRADTELLVELAAARLPAGAHFCDIGCGSGAVAVSVLLARPDTRATAVDISPGALEATRGNAESLGVADRCATVLADALSGSLCAGCGGGFDAVISNPPYIPSGDIPGLAPELAYEPHRALDGGSDGLTFYRAITREAERGLLAPGGFLLYEVGAGMDADVAAIGAEHGFECAVYRDISGIPRALLLTRGSGAAV